MFAISICECIVYLALYYVCTNFIDRRVNCGFAKKKTFKGWNIFLVKPTNFDLPRTVSTLWTTCQKAKKNKKTFNSKNIYSWNLTQHKLTFIITINVTIVKSARKDNVVVLIRQCIAFSLRLMTT